MNFFHAPETLATFERAFLKGYRLEAPVCQLKSLVHFAAQMSDLESKGGPSCTFANSPSSLFGGWFYNFTSPDPSQSVIETAVQRAQRLGTHQILVPTLVAAEDHTNLLKAGFKELPAFINSIYEQDDDPDLVLRERIGSHRLREIKRLSRKASKGYSLKWYSAKELNENPQLIKECSKLHGLNITSHNLPVNFYSEEVISLFAKAFPNNLSVALRHRASDQVPVQVAIVFTSDDQKDLFYVVQGIDHENVAKDQNLYIATIYDIYRHAFENGCKRVHLGRGGASAKARLGANIFQPLSNFLRPDPDKIKEAEAWGAFAKSQLNDELNALNTAVPASWQR